MTLIVEMVHRKEERPDPRFFSCHGDNWKQLLILAETFGWKPQGSVSANDTNHPTADYDKHFKPNYEPESWAYCKAVTKDDANNIALALLDAHDAIKSGKVALLPKSRTTIFNDEFNEDRFLSINSDLSQQLLLFGLFASQGGFLFAWDD
jgi:acyl-CoA-binding protein